MGTFTDTQVHAWLAEIGGEAWASLHFDSPASDGLGLSEISGGGYARVKILMSEPTNRTVWSVEDATWSGLSQTTLTHFGIWDSARGGLLRAYGELTPHRSIVTGQGYAILAGDLSLSVG